MRCVGQAADSKVSGSRSHASRATTVLSCLRSKGKTEPLPNYSRLMTLPSPDLRGESEDVAARSGAIERGLLDGVRRPADNAPLLTELLFAGRDVVTIP